MINIMIMTSAYVSLDADSFEECDDDEEDFDVLARTLEEDDELFLRCLLAFPALLDFLAFLDLRFFSGLRPRFGGTSASPSAALNKEVVT